MEEEEEGEEEIEEDMPKEAYQRNVVSMILKVNYFCVKELSE